MDRTRKCTALTHSHTHNSDAARLLALFFSKKKYYLLVALLHIPHHHRQQQYYFHYHISPLNLYHTPSTTFFLLRTRSPTNFMYYFLSRNTNAGCSWSCVQNDNKNPECSNSKNIITVGIQCTYVRIFLFLSGNKKQNFPSGAQRVVMHMIIIIISWNNFFFGRVC